MARGTTATGCSLKLPLKELFVSSMIKHRFNQRILIFLPNYILFIYYVFLFFIIIIVNMTTNRSTMNNF